LEYYILGLTRIYPFFYLVLSMILEMVCIRVMFLIVFELFCKTVRMNAKTVTFNDVIYFYDFIFQSSERREICVRQANASRNEYLLSLAALNGHMKRFREIDLTQILKVGMDVFIAADFLFQLTPQNTFMQRYCKNGI
jgi:hypothetical protein